MTLEKALAKLKQREVEQAISKWRAAVGAGATKKTRDEVVAERLRSGEKDHAIAADMGVSRERVRQLYRRYVEVTDEKIKAAHCDLLAITTHPYGCAFLSSYDTFVEKMDTYDSQ